MPSCGVPLSVCPSVMFVYSVEIDQHIFRIFSPSGSHTILVFPVPNATAIFLTGALNASGVGKNRDSR